MDGVAMTVRKLAQGQRVTQAEDPEFGTLLEHEKTAAVRGQGAPAGQLRRAVQGMPCLVEMTRTHRVEGPVGPRPARSRRRASHQDRAPRHGQAEGPVTLFRDALWPAGPGLAGPRAL